jgi:hypothetical protein
MDNSLYLLNFETFTTDTNKIWLKLFQYVARSIAKHNSRGDLIESLSDIWRKVPKNCDWYFAILNRGVFVIYNCNNSNNFKDACLQISQNISRKSILRYGGWFVPFVFLPRGPAMRKVKENNKNCGGAERKVAYKRGRRARFKK